MPLDPAGAWLGAVALVLALQIAAVIQRSQIFRMQSGSAVVRAKDQM